MTRAEKQAEWLADQEHLAQGVTTTTVYVTYLGILGSDTDISDRSLVIFLHSYTLFDSPTQVLTILPMLLFCRLHAGDHVTSYTLDSTRRHKNI